jgi:hypothetical protein
MRSISEKFGQLSFSQQILMFAGMGVGVMGIFLRYMELTSVGADPLFAAVIAIVASVAMYLILPSTWKNHWIYEIIEAQMGYTKYQIFVAGIFVVCLPHLFIRYGAVWIEKSSFSDPISIILLTNLNVYITLVLPGYMMLPISIAEARQDAKEAREAKLFEEDLTQIKETRRLTRAASLIVLRKLRSTDLESRHLALLLNRMLPASSSTKALPAPRDVEEDEFLRELSESTK